MINFKSKWVLYSIIATIFVTVYDLMRKYVIDTNIVHVEELIIFISIFIGLLGLCHLTIYKKTNSFKKVNPTSLIIIFFIALTAYAFNISFMRSMRHCSEVTLPVVVISLSAILIYLYSSLFFKKSPDFDWKILLGVVLTVLGLGIITIYFKE